MANLPSPSSARFNITEVRSRTPLKVIVDYMAISTEESDARQARYQEAKAALQAAQAALDSAKLDLEYTQVRAPIDGRVSRALLTEGNYVSGVCWNGFAADNPCFGGSDLRVCGR